MKIFTLLFTALLFFSTAMSQSIEVTTGSSYANDVYYSFENGDVNTVSRDNWDIGFYTNAMSAGIIANNGSNVEVYTYSKGDTSSWNSIDSLAMNWTALYNSVDDWQEGAFNRNASGHPDYGWGIYNMGNHNIYGDSIYILKTVAGDFKKLILQRKDAVNNTYYFKFANLDGSNENSITLDVKPYTSKNFVYYSLDSNQIVDREPNSEDWDLLFTKYFDYNIPYVVTGVLTNSKHALVEEVSQSGLDQANFNQYTEANFSDSISQIGSDWKSFNMTSFTYEVSDSTVFFAKLYNQNGDSVYWKMYFTAFGGSSDGKYMFEQSLLLHTDITEISESIDAEIYPNPADNFINIKGNFEKNAEISIIDVQGRVVYNKNYTGLQKESTLKINTNNLEKGVYFVRIKNSNALINKKIIVN